MATSLIVFLIMRGLKGVFKLRIHDFLEEIWLKKP